jgi:hypothetical protein
MVGLEYTQKKNLGAYDFPFTSATELFIHLPIQVMYILNIPNGFGALT